MVTQSSHSSLGLVAGAVASGVATALVPPSRIPPRARRSVHLGVGLATGAGAVWVLGRPDLLDAGRESGQVSSEPDGPSAGHADGPRAVPLRARVALASVLGGLMALSSAAGMALDGAAERALVRRGVRHPRVWIGVAAAGLTAAVSWAEDRSGSRDPQDTAPA